MSNYAPENTVGSQWRSENFASPSVVLSSPGTAGTSVNVIFKIETYREDNGNLSMYIFAWLNVSSTAGMELRSLTINGVKVNGQSLGSLTMHQIRQSDKISFTTNLLNVGKVAGESVSVAISTFDISVYWDYSGKIYSGVGTFLYDSYSIGIQNRWNVITNDAGGDGTRLIVEAQNKITITTVGYVQGYTYSLKILKGNKYGTATKIYEAQNLVPGDYYITPENSFFLDLDLNTGYDTNTKFFVDIRCFYNGAEINNYTYYSDGVSSKTLHVYVERNAYFGFVPNLLSWEILDEREYYDTAIIGRQNDVSVTGGYSNLVYQASVTGISDTAFQFSGFSYQWTPNAQTYGELMPNELYKAIEVSLKVYCGSKVIITKKKNISFELLETDATPTLSLTVSEVGGYVDDFGGYVVGQSKISVSAIGTALYGATSANYTIIANGQAYSQNVFVTGFLANVSYNTITATFTDSRGLSKTATQTIITVNWFRPVVNDFSVHRGTWDGEEFTPTQDGGYCKIDFDFSIAPVGNQNERYCEIEGSAGTEVIQLSSYSSQGYIIQVADPEESFEITLELRDSFGTYTWTIILSTAGAIMDFYRNGNGVAFGKVAEEELYLDVASEWTLRAYNIMVGNQTLAEYIRSVVGT